MISRHWLQLCVVAVLFSPVQGAYAALLGLAEELPIITFNDTGEVDYTASSGAFEVFGAVPQLITVPTLTDPFFDTYSFAGTSAFSISATMDPSGNVGAGSLTISGDVTIDGTLYSGTLLTASAVDFGFQDSGDTASVFDFLFNNLGGELAGFYAGSDLYVRVNSLEGSNFVDFTNDFVGSAAGISAATTSLGSGVAAAPTPSALLLGALGLSLVHLVRRKQA